MAHARTKGTGILNDTFTVTILRILQRDLHSQTLADIETHFKSVYQSRIQQLLQGRGIYSTGTVGVSVTCNMVTFAPSTKWETISAGDAFVILTDLNSVETGEDLKLEIQKLECSRVKPVIVRRIGADLEVKPECKSSEDMMRRGTCIDSSLLNGAFETLYRVMERDVGFIVPPKKARKYTKRR